MQYKLLRNKEEIINWLNQHEIYYYEILTHEKYGFVVNVSCDVFLTNKSLNFIAVKFNIVSGVFDCSNNNLVTLKGCPDEVEHHFRCSENKLTSLRHCPSKVGGSFSCSTNQLVSLKFAPVKVNGSFGCTDNKLKSLKFAPQQVADSFYCNRNELSSLQYGPKEVQGWYNASKNRISNLDFIPEKSAGSVILSDNPELGHWQKIKNFEEIRQEQLRIKKIINLKEKLEDKISLNIPTKISNKI